MSEVADLRGKVPVDPAVRELTSAPLRLTRRADFLHVGKGRRWHGKALTVQTAERDEKGEARIGFTLTKKVGCAVVRNRARRRLREAVRLSPELPLQPGNDYVIVGRLDAIRLPFADLMRELARAVTAVHRSAEGLARGPSKAGRNVRRRGKADGRTDATAVDTGGGETCRAEVPGADPKSAKSASPAGRTLERTKFTS